MRIRCRCRRSAKWRAARHWRRLVIVKATPEDSLALHAEYVAITPGYHMNKRHWITLHPGGDLDRQLVEDLVTESYLLVIERNLPRSQWPVDPRTFIRDAR